MLRLKPDLESPSVTCPRCGASMSPTDFLITGMRSLGDFTCRGCGRDFYGDLRAGQALFTPVLLEKETGAVHDRGNAPWFAEWLVEAYRHRTDQPINFEAKNFTKLREKAILLNCLDTLYGHSLLKLLNAQYYLDNRPDLSLVVLIPRALEWMLPDGVAEAWIVDLPFSRGIEWNDWLAAEISRRLEAIPEVNLSLAFSHPYPEDFDIERFTRIAPFDLAKRDDDTSPAVTFIWRDDRLWHSSDSKDSGIEGQRLLVIKLAETLRKTSPALDFAVAGLGESGAFPSWIRELRTTKFDNKTERTFCERYAQSDIVIGVHGSNMLLPSAHAGSVIELVSDGRWGNYLQDILFRVSDARDMFFRYRFLPEVTSAAEVAEIAGTMLRGDDFQKLMGREFVGHIENPRFEKWIMPARDT